MEVRLTREQVLALAPDAASAKAGGGLVIDGKWGLLGADDEALWGECQGSGSKPYQTQVDLAALVSRCSCPSRKFPCKHGLALLLLYAAGNPRCVPQARPAWVDEWLNGRRDRAARKEAAVEAAAIAPPPDPQAQAAATAKREQVRWGRIEAGAAELQRWIADQFRQGLANLPADFHAQGQTMVARMIDAQAPGLASQLEAALGEGTPGLAGLGELGARLGLLQLLTQAVARRAQYEPARLADLRAALGWPVVVPLQRDLEAQQKRLRLKPEALEKTLDLDLRKDNDLARSHLLHRLRLLGIEWGRLARTGHAARGTFHELWQLAWQPHFLVALVEASRHGQTLVDAASNLAISQARAAADLPALSELVDQVLLADLPQAVQAIAAELEARAATDADPLALLGALPPLANIHRYGNVRQTEGVQVAHLFDSMLERAVIGLSLALTGLDEARAEAAREVVLAAERAISLRDDADGRDAWRQALRRVALSQASTALLRGVSLRLLFDTGALDAGTVHTQLQQQLSPGAEPLQAAQWLDGFLNRNATVLLHDDAVWRMIDDWVVSLDETQLVRVLPLVRRTFAAFEAADRRDLGTRVARATVTKAVASEAPDWNLARAERALPMLRELLGIAG